MPTRLVLAAAAALLAALPSTASAQFVVPRVAVGYCDLEATNGTVRCVVQLSPKSAASFVQSTHSGYGTAELYCHYSGYRDRISGGYGTTTHKWSHAYEVCELTLHASGGTSYAYVD